MVTLGHHYSLISEKSTHVHCMLILVQALCQLLEIEKSSKVGRVACRKLKSPIAVFFLSPSVIFSRVLVFSESLVVSLFSYGQYICLLILNIASLSPFHYDGFLSKAAFPRTCCKEQQCHVIILKEDIQCQTSDIVLTFLEVVYFSILKALPRPILRNFVLFCLTQYFSKLFQYLILLPSHLLTSKNEQKYQDFIESSCGK